MCFDLRHTLFKAKIITKKGNHEKEEDSKGLLAKEIEIWEKQQKEMINEGTDHDNLQPLDSSSAKNQ